MAGMPVSVLEKANALLRILEQSHSSEEIGKKETGDGKRETGRRRRETGDRKKETGRRRQETGDGYQLSFIQLDDPLLEQIKEDILNTDINTLTPVEALMKLNEIKRLLTGEG